VTGRSYPHAGPYATQQDPPIFLAGIRSRSANNPQFVLPSNKRIAMIYFIIYNLSTNFNLIHFPLSIVF
jgi:hypothetical protein